VCLAWCTAASGLARSKTKTSAVTGRKDKTNKARVNPERGIRRKPEVEPMYVANSEPAKWQRGGGRAGARERALISGEPNRSGAGRDMGRQCSLPREDLLLWWGPLLAPVENRPVEGEPRGGKGAEVGRSADSTEDSGPMKLGNRVEEKTLTTRRRRPGNRPQGVGSRRRKVKRTTAPSGDRVSPRGTQKTRRG
jgi:hypothetical protein